MLKPTSFDHLPIIQIENNLPIVRIENLNISHENVIIEENTNKPKSASLYETVSIYEAFNSGNNNNNSSNVRICESKRFRIKILEPIRSSSDFIVQNVNEGKYKTLRVISGYFGLNWDI